MILKSIKVFVIFSFFGLPFFVNAEVSCLPSATSTLVGEDISWTISGLGEELPYFISWSSDGVANTPEDSLVYSNKYETIGEKSARVLFGLEGVEPTYDIVCEPIFVMDNIIKSFSTTSLSTTTEEVVKKRRGHTVVQIFSDEVVYGDQLILSTSTNLIFSTSTEKEGGEEVTKEILPIKNFFFTKKLWIGLEGEEVRELQKRLSELGFFNTEVTGFFGLITQKAVIDFQKYHDIEPSLGFVGPLTRDVLNKL